MQRHAKEPISGQDTLIGKSDWFIQNLVFLAKSGIELPVILNTTGGIISGTVISGERYLDLLSTQARDAARANPAYRELGDWFEQYLDVVANDDAEGDGPYFIHLNNATSSMPNGAAVQDKPRLWRGRIREAQFASAMP